MLVVHNFNYALFVVFGISFSADLLASTTGVNESSVVEKVNYTIRFYSVQDLKNQSKDVKSDGRFVPFLKWLWPPTPHCWFTFQCPAGCRCNLAATNIAIQCPGGLSVVDVMYPYYWLPPEEELEASVTIYYWYHTGLNSITPGAFEYLANISECHLFIQRNNIKDIPARLFKELSNLDGLYLDNNKIVSLHQNAFMGLTTLGYLHLYKNKIADILPNQFQELANLSELYLDYNNISAIGHQDFQGLINLRFLDIAYNKIKVIHPGCFHWITNLRSLNIGFNSISQIEPKTFQENTYLKGLYLEHNNITTIHPQLFQNLPWLIWLHIDHNNIAAIDRHIFQNYTKLEWLRLDHNIITVIHPLQFQGLTNLFVLQLQHNNITVIHPKQFQDHIWMQWLWLDHNNIVAIHPNQFQNINFNQFYLKLGHNNIAAFHPLKFKNSMQILFLNHNNISEIFSKQFLKALNLKVLHLNHNKISVVHPEGFQGLSALRQLELQNNRISSLQSKHFESFHNLASLDLSNNILVKFTLTSTVIFSDLKYLSLSNNKLRVLSHATFQYNIMVSLNYLDLSRNHINMISSMKPVNNSIAPIDVIDLRKNNLHLLNTKSFIGFRNVTRILVDNEATCCFIKTANCSATIPKSQFLTCGRLLPNMIQRVNMWTLGLFTLFSNICVLFYRYRYKQKENKVQLLLISNLTISDTIMGIYMIIIVSADSYYKTMFSSEFWRLSFTCKFAGTLSILSSEASVFFVTMISVDRFMGIKYAFSPYRICTKIIRIISSILWIIAILISTVSTIISSINPDFYDVSEVCTGLPLSRKNVFEKRFDQHNLGKIPAYSYTIELIVNNTYDVVTSHEPGMYFGMAIFIALNSICFMVVCVCYFGIFLTSIQTAKNAGRTRDHKQERRMATRMGAIIFTDLACWAPIIILSILVQSGRHIVSPHVYTWIVTFVLPINSAINPFLYTLASLVFDFFDKL